ncbi:MAG: hypothetical protein QOE70_2123, partial [Chthoniobacter sp.]|nr:hypothetical protein [Chthoniobacter sp.]
MGSAAILAVVAGFQPATLLRVAAEPPMETAYAL